MSNFNFRYQNYILIGLAFRLQTKALLNIDIDLAHNSETPEMDP